MPASWPAWIMDGWRDDSLVSITHVHVCTHMHTHTRVHTHTAGAAGRALEEPELSFQLRYRTLGLGALVSKGHGWTGRLLGLLPRALLERLGPAPLAYFPLPDSALASQAPACSPQDFSDSLQAWAAMGGVGGACVLAGGGRGCFCGRSGSAPKAVPCGTPA